MMRWAVTCSPTCQPGNPKELTTSYGPSGVERKRALLQHFGSPDAIVAASSEELEAVPGISGKLARELHRELHRTGV